MHDLASRVSKACRIVVFSGAGISTESGIDDFRGPEGVWKRHQPVYFDEFLADIDKRREHWKYKRQSWEQFKDAEPNAGHMAVVQWQQQGKLLGVITQNIDGLHEAAGLPREALIELHGTNLHVMCVGRDGQGCGWEMPARLYFETLDPKDDWEPCDQCGGWIKPSTVSFGQSLPPMAMQQSARWCGECDLFIVLGSSLEVSPANLYPQLAKDNGAQLVIINREPTPLDSIADLVIHAGIGETLAEL